MIFDKGDREFVSLSTIPFFQSIELFTTGWISDIEGLDLKERVRYPERLQITLETAAA